MEYLLEFGVFSGKALIIVIACLVVFGFIAMLALKNKLPGPQLELEDLNKKYKSYREKLDGALLSKKDLKSELKKTKKENKLEKKKTSEKRKVFILSFNGGMKAEEVEQFRDEVTAVLTHAKTGDEVVVCLESPGGVVHGYGLAAAQMLRIKSHGCKLTACVDKVAASGGYMMACTADKIICAPFAILGSIGVLAQIPNLHKLLKKHDVEVHEITAGKYKRTLTMLGEVTEPKKDKMKEQLEDTHILFKDFVTSHRPQIDIEKVGTGEYWFGQRAFDLKLCDELATSDEYLFNLRNEATLLKIKLKKSKKFSEKISEAMSIGINKSVDHFLQNSEFPRS